MKRQRIEALLECLGAYVPKAQPREDWVVSHCPFAPWDHQSGVDNNPSFGVKVVPGGRSFFHCWSCGAGGGLEDLFLDLYLKAKGSPDLDLYDWKTAQDIVDSEADEPIDGDGFLEAPGLPQTKHTVSPWPEHYLDAYKPVTASLLARGYLVERGVLEVSEALDLRFDPSRMRVCFPIRDWEGLLAGLHGRRITDKPPPYYAYGWNNKRNPIVWLGEHWVDEDRPVVLVESVFDLARVYRVYRNVMCALSAGLSKEKVERVNHLRSAVTMFDWGKGGDAARDAIDKYAEFPCVHLVPPEAAGDPGNMTLGLIDDLLSQHLEVDEWL